MLELLIFILFLLTLVTVTGYFVGKFISLHFIDNPDSQKTRLEVIFEKIEAPIYRFCGINPQQEMTAKEYFLTLFWSNIVLCIISFFVLYFQNILPYRGNVKWQLDIPLILHIISSLITNTCQTHHIPEIHLTHLSNYFLMPLLMFYSSASGIATGIVVIRGVTLGKIGNSYVDVIKSMTRILFPISFILSIIYTASGMPNTFTSYINYNTLENIKEKIIIGPVAAFEAIKLFGENGLSCFNANSAHPFENPSYLSNFLQLATILIIPFALIFTMGFWLKNQKQAFVILSTLVFILIFESTLVTIFEINGNKQINNLLNINSPNWINKETRLGIVGSSVFQASISNVSGSNNSSLDSIHPITNIFGIFNLSNQSIFGVQGFGTVFTINFILYTVFLIGLMTGRTPEIFGKRIEKNEIILSSILLLLNPILVLLGSALTLILIPEFSPSSPSFYDQIHYYTRVFYEFASGAASNGSGLEGLNDNTTYWNLSLAIVMFVARYGAMASMILLGGSLACKPSIPSTVSTFRTDNMLFGFIFLFMSVVSTVLIYFPFMVLGPISEILIQR